MMIPSPTPLSHVAVVICAFASLPPRRGWAKKRLNLSFSRSCSLRIQCGKYAIEEEFDSLLYSSHSKLRWSWPSPFLIHVNAAGVARVHRVVGTKKLHFFRNLHSRRTSSSRRLSRMRNGSGVGRRARRARTVESTEGSSLRCRSDYSPLMAPPSSHHPVRRRGRSMVAGRSANRSMKPAFFANVAMDAGAPPSEPMGIDHD